MLGLTQRLTGMRFVRLAVAASALGCAVPIASAGDDAGVHNFFSSQAGASYGVETAAPAPGRGDRVVRTERASRPRSLTVRLRHPSPVVQVARSDGPAPKITIYEDPTLRRGDAVMTTRGIRVFAGSRSWPYRDDDFVALADARRMDPEMRKVLAELDRLPQ